MNCRNDAIEVDMRKKNKILLNPHFVNLSSASNTLIQLSVHAVETTSFMREARLVFPHVNMANLIVIPTMQQSRINLVSFGDTVEIEKDRCLESFFEFAEQFCKDLTSRGYWADFIDPCSGLPMKTQSGNKVFNEVESATVLLSYKFMNAGCCKILLHPIWGSSVYPATMFTTAPSEVVLQLIASMEVVPNVLSCSGGSVDGSSSSNNDSSDTKNPVVLDCGLAGKCHRSNSGEDIHAGRGDDECKGSNVKTSSEDRVSESDDCGVIDESDGVSDCIVSRTNTAISRLQI